MQIKKTPSAVGVVRFRANRQLVSSMRLSVPNENTYEILPFSNRLKQIEKFQKKDK